MSRKVKIEYYTIEGYSLDFHKLIINFMPLCLCWITIPGSFLILRNMTPNSWQLTGATRSEVRLNGSELSWLLLQRRDKRGSTCPCEGDQWTLTGDWRLAPAKVRMEALQTERPSCYWASLGLRHTDWQLDIYCLVVIRHISIWLLAVQTCSHFNPQYNGKVGVELQKVMQFNASTFRSECTLAKYNVYHIPCNYDNHWFKYKRRDNITSRDLSWPSAEWSVWAPGKIVLSPGVRQSGQTGKELLRLWTV